VRLADLGQEISVARLQGLKKWWPIIRAAAIKAN